MIDDQIKQMVAVKVADLLVIANSRYGRNLIAPPIKWDCNDTRGGYYSTRDGVLHFNPTLTVQNLEHYIAVTVTHEMAHYIQHKVYPETLDRTIRFTMFGGTRRTRRSIHGREWQSIMRVFGIRNPERCHSYDVSDVPKRRVFKKVPVYCSCSVHEVTNKIVMKLQAGRTYTCRKCRTRISLTKPLTPAVESVSYSI